MRPENVWLGGAGSGSIWRESKARRPANLSAFLPRSLSTHPKQRHLNAATFTPMKRTMPPEGEQQNTCNQALS
ncbi:hypothetical protein C0J52_18296 [Blattella germanica]|nr:hypothetical protein C0J52_18296 [Blattella germanica]